MRGTWYQYDKGQLTKTIYTKKKIISYIMEKEEYFICMYNLKEDQIGTKEIVKKKIGCF